MFGFIKYKLKLKLFQKKFRMQNRHNFVSLANICDLTHIEVGRESYGFINLIDFSNAGSKLIIGNYCSVAGNVQFLLGGEHNLDTVSTYPFKVMKFGAEREAGSKGNIILNDDVWIGVFRSNNWSGSCNSGWCCRYKKRGAVCNSRWKSRETDSLQI